MHDVAGAAAQVRFLGTSSDKCARQAWRRAVQELGDLRWKEAKDALDAARETVLRQYDAAAVGSLRQGRPRSLGGGDGGCGGLGRGDKRNFRPPGSAAYSLSV